MLEIFKLNSQVASVAESVGEGFAQEVISVEDTPGGLHEAVQQTVAGRAVPQGVESRAQVHGDLERPVHYGRVVLQLPLGVLVQQFLKQLFLHGCRQLFYICTNTAVFNNYLLFPNKVCMK